MRLPRERCPQAGCWQGHGDPCGHHALPVPRCWGTAAPRALPGLVAMMVHIHSLVFRWPLLIKNSIVMGTGSPAPGIFPVPPKPGLTATGRVQNHRRWCQCQNTGR